MMQCKKFTYLVQFSWCLPVLNGVSDLHTSELYQMRTHDKKWWKIGIGEMIIYESIVSAQWTMCLNY
jgi:hypothetical protein